MGFAKDIVAGFIGTVLAFLVIKIWWKHGESYSEYVPSLEGFERMDLQSPALLDSPLPESSRQKA